MSSSVGSVRASPRLLCAFFGWVAALLLAIALSLACGRYGRPVRTPPTPPTSPAPTAVDEPTSEPAFDLQTPDFGVGDDNGLEEEEEDGGN